MLPRLRLKRQVEVTVAGPETSVVYLGKNGYPCKSEASIPDMKASEFDALVVPGGFMPDKLRRDPVVDLVDFDTAKTLLQSVMAAGFHISWCLFRHSGHRFARYQRRSAQRWPHITVDEAVVRIVIM